MLNILRWEGLCENVHSYYWCYRPVGVTTSSAGRRMCERMSTLYITRGVTTDRHAGLLTESQMRLNKTHGCDKLTDRSRLQFLLTTVTDPAV